MAKATGVWGIEIGQSALKALRCRRQGDDVIADAFDFIEYPKILSQPEADPEELIREALEKFLERNDARGLKIAISVPGQSGLAKFFKPPPVEAKKIADIVKYEARQQIPFDLDDVIWDYQMMPGSTIEDGYALETEVGLFAMKRDQAYRQLRPFEQAGLEVDVIQLAPLALYNMLAFDRMHERIANESFDPDSPPTSSVILSIGTDSSDLIVTNGFRIWQRSMPLGGNHFTRQLTKDLKLTFAKAEHLKRNAREAEDPKLVFQTMRPVFNDLVTEVQRSIGFFRSINKKAEITELLITGNTVKMPGLAQYLGKNLGYDVHVIDRFERLAGDDVLSVPAFRDNAATFGVCYGLALQGLGNSQIRTSLVPKEILTERMIRAKKPWALTAVAALLLGMTGHYVFTERSWADTHPDKWQAASASVEATKSYSAQHKSQDGELTAKLNYLTTIGSEVSGNTERRLVWLEMLQAVNQILPRTEYPDDKIPSHKEVPYEDRKDIHVKTVDTRFYPDLATWFSEPRKKRYLEELASLSQLTGKPLPEGLAEDPGPTGPGWVVELQGYHFYNSPERIGYEGSNHIRRELTTQFLNAKVTLPGAGGVEDQFTLQELGIGYPLLLTDNKPVTVPIPNPDYVPPAGGAGATGFGEAGAGYAGAPGYAGGAGYAGAAVAPGGAAAADGAEAPEPRAFQVKRQDFIYQFVWVETPLTERLQKRKEAAEQAAQEALENPDAGDAPATDEMATTAY